MPKRHKNRKQNKQIIPEQKFNKIIALGFLVLLVISVLVFANREIIENTIGNISGQKTNKDEKLKILFTGDIFLDRNIDIHSRNSSLKFAYPFQGLNTFGKENYNAWIGNLECPVTEAQSTMYEKENYLKFSCKKEYLSELAKWYNAVSLANNHTDNMNGRAGILETRKHLLDAGIKYFGDFDNTQSDEICKIIFIKNSDTEIPIAMCGFHGVFKLPTEEDMKVIDEYSKYFVTIVMPHQGVEYAPHSNSYQEKIYREFIDHGADAVIGSHPHVIEEVEEYKGKVIFYSLGNFIFDQNWNKTRNNMTVDTEINFPKYSGQYAKLNCEKTTEANVNKDCLNKAKELNIVKPEFTIKFKPIFTHSELDFITRKKDLTDKEYENELKSIGFNNISISSKI